MNHLLSPFANWCCRTGINVGTLNSQFADSKDIYQAMCWIVNYLENNVISSVNENIDKVEELESLYTQLKNFVEHYFDNLDVQNEINIKLDAMAEEGTLGDILGVFFEKTYQPVIESQNANIANINGRVDQISTKINDIVSLNPIPVSSVEAMSDHSKVYLLTTNGHWYYWNTSTSSFTDGGAYQSAISTEIDDSNIKYKGITPASLKEYTTINLATDFGNSNFGKHLGMSIQPSGAIQTGLTNNYVTYEFIIPKNSFISVNKADVTNRFRIGLSTTRPVNGTTVDVVSDNASLTNVSLFTGNYSWIAIQISNNSEDATVNVYQHTRNQMENLIGAENMIPFTPVEAGTELYNPSLKLQGVVIGNTNNKYALQKNSQTVRGRSYMFGLVPKTTYTIEKSGGDRFKVALYRNYPTFQVSDNDSGQNYFNCRPSEVVIDQNDATSTTFDSKEYKYCVITTSVSAEEYALSIKANKQTYELSKQWYSVDLGNNGVYIFNPEVNSLNDFWSKWNGRLAWGINTSIAPVPVQMNSALFVDGMIITHLNSALDHGNNRHGKHVFEAYDSDNYSRMTMLLGKHRNDVDNKPSFEQYYYTGTNHNATSYGNIRIGSDVKNHSFSFSRDKMTAEGTIDCKFPLQLARINQSTDLDRTYQTVAQADNAYEAENSSTANVKCIKYLSLKNAPNGTMFYDTQRNKVVVKVNGSWQDLNTTPVPADTYDF